MGRELYVSPTGDQARVGPAIEMGRRAATNHPGSLDPATLRRFVFKLDLRPLGHERSERAFERFFGMRAPASLAEFHNLTPGDFAVVARQLRHAPAADAREIVERLRLESLMKPERGGRLGF